MISVRGPKMKGRKSLLMRVFIISGLGALLSGRNNVTCRTSSRVTVLRLKGSSMGVRSTLISSGIVMLFWPDARRPLRHFYRQLQKTGWIRLLRISDLLNKFASPWFWKGERDSLSSRERGFFWCNLTTSKVWFLSVSSRVFLTKWSDSLRLARSTASRV